MRSGVLQRETIARRQAANAALAQVLATSPTAAPGTAPSPSVGQTTQLPTNWRPAHLISLRRGSATAAIWALERSAQLTTDPARRGRRLLLAAEHAFGLGRADLVDQLLTRAAQTSLSRLDRARMEWLREIFNDGVPGDAGRVLELCDIALEAISAADSDLALNLLLGAALRCWWADTGPAARAQVAEVAHLLEATAPDDPRYVAVARRRRAGAAEPEVIASWTRRRAGDRHRPGRALAARHGRARDRRPGPGGRTSSAGPRRSCASRAGSALLSQVLTMQVLDHVELGDWDRAAVLRGGGQAAGHGHRPADLGHRLAQSLQAVIAALRGDRRTRRGHGRRGRAAPRAAGG